MALLLTLCGVIAGNNLALSWLVTLLTTLGVLVKGWVDVRNTGRKEEISRFAYTNHEKTLIELRTFVRGVVPTELTGFLIKQQTVEDLITDFAPFKRTRFRYRCNCGDCIEFQYRILNRYLTTNSFLHKIGPANSPLCTFCTQESESLEHC